MKKCSGSSRIYSENKFSEFPNGRWTDDLPEYRLDALITELWRTHGEESGCKLGCYVWHMTWWLECPTGILEGHGFDSRWRTFCRIRVENASSFLSPICYSLFLRLRFFPFFVHFVPIKIVKLYVRWNHNCTSREWEVFINVNCFCCLIFCCFSDLFSALIS